MATTYGYSNHAAGGSQLSGSCHSHINGVIVARCPSCAGHPTEFRGTKCAKCAGTGTIKSYCSSCGVKQPLSGRK